MLVTRLTLDFTALSEYFSGRLRSAPASELMEASNDILAKIYPRSVAQVTYLKLIGKQPPESAEDAEGLRGLEPIKEEEA